MEHICDKTCEHKAQLDATAIALEESSRLLTKLIFSGSDDVIESAYAALRVAKVRFSAVRADCRDMCQMSY